MVANAQKSKIRNVPVLLFQTKSYLCMKARAMEYIQLYTKLNRLPDDLKSEVNNFIDFLLSKYKKEKEKKKPKFGYAQGEIYISPDFDEPLEDFKEYM